MIDELVDELLHAARQLGLEASLRRDEPLGSWWARCPACEIVSETGELELGVDPAARSLEITRSGRLRCHGPYGCDLDSVAIVLDSAVPSRRALDRVEAAVSTAAVESEAANQPGDALEALRARRRAA